jgi:hypothetical protein
MTMTANDFVLECSSEVKVETYTFCVNTYAQADGSRTLSEAVLALMEERANRTFASPERQKLS